MQYKKRQACREVLFEIIKEVIKVSVIVAPRMLFRQNILAAIKDKL